jgi:hypothetical protein
LRETVYIIREADEEKNLSLSDQQEQSS